MCRFITIIAIAAFLLVSCAFATDRPPNGGSGAGTVPIWNPHKPTPDNPPLTVRVLVLNYDPIVPGEGKRTLSQVFNWNSPAMMVRQYKEAMEYASGGYLFFDIVAFRNLNEIYAQEGDFRYTIEEYVKNRKSGKDWRPNGMADYPRLLKEQNVAPLVDDGRVDEVWVFGDHFFGLWEASMAGPGAFFINGGVYPQVPTRRPFAFYGFNYERGVAEMMHNTSHRTEATMNRAYGPWNLKEPRNNWEKFSANDTQSGGLAGVGTCHWPANATGDYDYGNQREVASWAHGFLKYPQVEFTRRDVTSATWSKGPDYHLDYMKYYFAHLPRASGVNADGRQNNWMKYVFDFQSYDTNGQPLPASAELISGNVTDAKAKTHLLRVAYRSAEQVNFLSLDDDDISVTGPDGNALEVKLVAGNEEGNRSYRVAHYMVTARGTAWEKAGNSGFTVTLRTDSVRTLAGKAFPGGELGVFRFVRPGEASRLTADADTTLLAHFDGDALGEKKLEPDETKGLRFVPGVSGQAAVIDAGAVLRYPCKGVLEMKAGSVEFWVNPTWSGNASKGHVFFQTGLPFDNAIIVQVDGANNLRLMTWGDDSATATVENNVERGVGTSVSGWKAGEWHHVAATWADFGRKLTLHVDGRLANSTTKGIDLQKSAQPSFTIGASPDGNSSAAASFDELRISNIARTEAEIRASAER